MTRHEKNEKGIMGAAISIVLGIFLVLHFVFPGATLWPIALISLVAASMFASHYGRSCKAREGAVRIAAANRNPAVWNMGG